jgi:hypothetical protein
VESLANREVSHLPANRGQRLSFATGNPVYSSPAVANGVVYVASGYYVHAFGL